MRLTFDSDGADKLLGRVGFGCWGLGGDSYGAIDQNDAIELVRYAYEHGIRAFDTSPLYGDGTSEQILGLSLREYNRKTFTLITKAGLFKKDGEEIRDYRPERIKISVTESLSRLNMDYIDYFLIHSPNENEFRENSFVFCGPEGASWQIIERRNDPKNIPKIKTDFIFTKN